MSLDDLIAKYGRHQGALIPILQGIQKEYRYLPQDVLHEVCAKTDATPADIFAVSTFYDQFRHAPAGKHSVCVCTGTACHVKGADRVLRQFQQTLGIKDGEDTDPTRLFTIQEVSCLGCCTLAPVVQIDGITHGHLMPEQVPGVLEDFKFRMKNQSANRRHPLTGQPKHHIAVVRVGLGSCCQAQGSAMIYDEVAEIINELSLDIRLEGVGCVGMCHQTPLLEAVSKQGISTFYGKVQPEDVRAILLQNYKPKSFLARTGYQVGRYLEKIWSGETTETADQRFLDVEGESVRAFMSRQYPIAMQNSGMSNPGCLEDYRKHNGFDVLHYVLRGMPPASIIHRLEQAGLRGRGGAGFPTHRKWAIVRQEHAELTGGTAGSEEIETPTNRPSYPSDSIKYVICNGDEGDPGAFMDRMLLESSPFRIIEGMCIAAKAVGASQGFLYIRAEYPLAIQRVQKAIDLCYENGLLGSDILGSGFSFDLTIQEGAGAFVCGEETALLESMEGRRGMPRLRPPFPAQSGLYGLPTLINNVETFALIPSIFSASEGAMLAPKNYEYAETSQWRQQQKTFEQLGTEKSKGTKVFALAGKVRRGGLIEVPMGVTIRQIVEEIGGGIQQEEGKTKTKRTFKAVQIGGPSGGCVPESLADTPVDFESLIEVGAIMGSGGLVVLDNKDCMVDIARYFLRFTQKQSCGKCTFCRIGTRRMLDILDRLCEGQGKQEDLAILETLALQIKSASICGLGKTAPNPVLSTMRYFLSEYEAHVRGECPAGKCSALIEYHIDETCNGCSICAGICPVSAISATPYRRHCIDTALCSKCDGCRSACPHDAVIIRAVSFGRQTIADTKRAGAVLHDTL